MEMLKEMKHTLMCAAQAQMTHLDCVNAEELGAVIDMIKDLEEAMYYCTITEAMNKKEEKGYEEHRGDTNIYYSEPLRDRYDRMYYDGGQTHKTHANGHDNGAATWVHPDGRVDHSTNDTRDPREGNSSKQRRMYMESKQIHHGKAKQLQELEKYMKDLSSDLVEMIEDSSPEEKQYLGNRLSALASKIAKLDND